MDAQYEKWNRAIGGYFFGADHEGERVFLTVDDDTLWDISQHDDSLSNLPSAEAAVEDFINAVYREALRSQWGWLSRFTIKPGQFPSVLGLIALQVLAVFKMHRDEEWTEQAYWGRLRELLGDPSASYMPLGLTRDKHQALWRTGYEYWANNIMSEKWGTVLLPSDQPGSSTRHVSLPKSQALLNRQDLDKLPPFFTRAGFRPHEDLDLDTMCRQVKSLAGDSTLFGSHARRVLNDDRFESACEQIRTSLRFWDGAPGAGNAQIWFQLYDFTSPYIEGGLLWGQNRPVKQVQLADVLGRQTYRFNDKYIFRPFHDDYVFTTRDDFGEIWLERRNVKPGDDVILLVKSWQQRRWMDEIEKVAEPEIKYFQSDKGPHIFDYRSLQGLPRGWLAIRFHIQEVLPKEIPDWIRRDPVQFLGGLRLDHNRWMLGAGPTINIQVTNVDRILIDDVDYALVEKSISPYEAPCLNNPGTHRIRLPGTAVVKKFECVDTEIAADLPEARGWRQGDEPWPVPEWLYQENALQLDQEMSAPLLIQGPAIIGEIESRQEVEISLLRQWWDLVVCIRENRPIGMYRDMIPSSMQHHLLLKQLAKVIETRRHNPNSWS